MAAGKTTLCNLVARFYDPSEGRVLLDGRDCATSRWRATDVCSASSNKTCFCSMERSRRILRYARRGATQDEIRNAAEAANAHEFIARLELGYESVIGERGVKLSGGQRQRLAIARALLADPKILILDEATSNLDTESEQLIQQSLQMLMRGRTSFVIAHRMSTVALANRIAVLEDGQLVEIGTHDELMAVSSRYRRMVELQTSPESGVKMPL
ncbi:MAG: ATP-binding cassette domain-containing protein [Pirellulaceae bacterium]